MTDLPPRRKPYLIMGVEDRIGTTSVPIDCEKVVGVLESDYMDQTSENTPADDTSKANSRPCDCGVPGRRIPAW